MKKCVGAACVHVGVKELQRLQRLSKQQQDQTAGASGGQKEGFSLNSLIFSLI